MSRRWLQLLTLASTLCATSISFAAGRPRIIELWQGPAPEEPGTIGPERVRMSPRLERRQVEVTESTRMITGVTVPTITIMSPTSVANTGTAVLIFPGGGYWDLYWELEGEEVAAWLNSLGITGVIVKYRVPRRPDEIEGEPARRPLQDAQRAMRIVRSRASEFDIDPQRIGVIGFSAGGHLAIATATSFEKRTYEPIDAIDQVEQPARLRDCRVLRLFESEGLELACTRTQRRRQHAACLPRAWQRRHHQPAGAQRGDVSRAQTGRDSRRAAPVRQHDARLRCAGQRPPLRPLDRRVCPLAARSEGSSSRHVTNGVITSRRSAPCSGCVAR